MNFCKLLALRCYHLQSIKFHLAIITKTSGGKMESSYQSIILLVIGAIIGFLSSFISAIGIDLWKEHSHKKELKKRIVEELEIIRKNINDSLEMKSFSSGIYFMDAFTNLKQELISKLSGKYYRAILHTYEKIESLKAPIEQGFGMPYAQEVSANRCKEAIDKIDETLKLLK